MHSYKRNQVNLTPLGEEIPERHWRLHVIYHVPWRYKNNTLNLFQLLPPPQAHT